MKTLRVFLPHGAHIRFDGVSNFVLAPDSITFEYAARDAKGDFIENSFAKARFQLTSICGYAVEA